MHYAYEPESLRSWIGQIVPKVIPRKIAWPDLLPGLVLERFYYVVKPLSLDKPIGPGLTKIRLCTDFLGYSLTSSFLLPRLLGRGRRRGGRRLANRLRRRLDRDGAGGLANKFLLVSNIEARDHGTAVAAGNGRVVRARLSDAKFFWDTDRKRTLAAIRSETRIVKATQKGVRVSTVIQNGSVRAVRKGSEDPLHKLPAAITSFEDLDHGAPPVADLANHSLERGGDSRSALASAERGHDDRGASPIAAAARVSGHGTNRHAQGSSLSDSAQRLAELEAALD